MEFELSEQSTLIVIGISFLVSGSISLLIRWQRKKRREAVRQLAEELGFDFVGWLDLVGHVPADYKLFDEGGDLARHYFERDDAHTRTTFFEYVPNGKDSFFWSVTYSAVRFRFKGLNLPRFALRNRSFVRLMDDFISKEPIDIEHDADLASSYLLEGKDEAAIKKLFDTSLTKGLLEFKSFSVEGKGPELLVYKRGKLDVDEIRSFLSDGVKILQLFLTSVAHSH